jgi:argininosuccinate lyase
MLERDFERAVEIYRRVNKCPLGSAAFASSSYKLDREYAAKLLGFDDIVENSEDAVASRDFLIESVYLCTSIMLSLSRIAEEVILWSSEFGFIELSDRYASVSSIMPQKKNPDIAELLRANAGRLIGNLSTVTSIYKALPFSYNRDFQEMNEVLYDSLLRTELALEVAAGMLSEIKFKEDVMRDKVAKEFVCATDLADMLVKNYGLPFRVAHRIVARLAHSEIFKPRASDIQEVAKDFGFNIKLSEDDLRKAMDIDSIVESRIIRGGTALEEVTRMLVERKKRLEEKRAIIEKLKRKVADALENLYTEAMKLGVDFHGSG